MYMVSNVLSDTYASGLTAQFANFAGDKGFGFNLNTSGGYELYVKNTTWNKALTISNTNAVTLTGALSGTSATFSANFVVNGSSIDINPASGQPNITIRSGNTFRGYIEGNSAGGMSFGTGASAAICLTLASTGAATFSSSVLVKKNGSDSANDALALVNAAGDRYFNWQLDSSGNLAGWRYSGSGFAQWLSVNYSNGNVGIGTTAPGFTLDVHSGSAGSIANYNTTRTGGGGFAIANNGNARLYLGTANWTGISGESTSSTAIALSSAENSAIIFATNAAYSVTERMRITSGGTVLIGVTSEDAVGGITIRPTGTTMVFNNLNTAPTVMSFQYNSSAVGSITRSTTTTSYNITSDYRLKEDLKPIKGLEILNKIKVYDYKWKSEDTRMDGVMAHELAEVLPYAVTGVKDGAEMQSVDYSKIVPVLIQAIKDQQVQIEQLKNK